MDIRLHQAFLPHLDPDGSLAFYRDALGMEVHEDVGTGAMRWITFGHVDARRTSVTLGPPVASAGVTDQERRTILDLMAKGVYGRLCLATPDLAGVFARLEAHGAGEVMQEPKRRSHGRQDCAFLDPAGNLLRIVEEP